MFEFIIPIIENYGLAGILLAIFAEGMMIPIPSEIVVPLGGFLASKGFFSLITLAFWASILNFLGALIIFKIGTKITFIHKIKFLERHLTMSKNFFKHFGKNAVFFGRLTPAVRMFIPFPAAVSGFKLKKFIPLTLTASFIWNFVLSFAGYFLGENWELIHAYGKYLTILVIAVLPIAYFLYRRYEDILLNLDKKDN